jgi:hypothetical protein
MVNPCGPATLCALLVCAMACGQSDNSFNSFQVVSTRTGVQVPPGSGTISAAIAANPRGSMEFKLGCGVYFDNVTISSSFNWIHGGGQGCTVLKPLNTALPALLVAQAGSNPLDYTRLSDMTISAYGQSSAAPGIRFTSNAKAPSNNFGTYKDIRIEFFQTNIDIEGGNVWNNFENISVINATGNNITVSPIGGQPVNHFRWSNLIDMGAGGYGFYAAIQGSSATWTFEHADIEGNGAKILTSNCAGFYLNASGVVWGLTFTNQTYLESNCTNGDASAAQVRLTGTGAVYNANIHDTHFSGASVSGCGFFADVAAGAGVIEENFGAMQRSACGSIYRIVNNDTGQGGSRQGFSKWRIGPNIYVNQGQNEYSFSGAGMMAYVGTTSGGVINFANGIASGGTNVVFRCTTAGTLPAGGLTINRSDCGASADTGVRVK